MWCGGGRGGGGLCFCFLVSSDLFLIFVVSLFIPAGAVASVFHLQRGH